jgi:hypothetical protein
MARKGRPTKPPAPLAPEQRTVGQLVAEAIRFYGAHFWRSLSLGMPWAAIAVAAAPLERNPRIVFVVSTGAVAFALSLTGASALAAGRRVPRRSLVIAFITGVLVYIPVPLLAVFFILPALAWLALVGLAVPAAVIEGRSLGAAFTRGVQLARADYVHALGGLAALAIVTFLSQWVLFFVLRGAGEATLISAALLVQLVMSPLLFLGAALLYFDQAARAVRSRATSSPRRSRHADLPADDDADRSGSADAEGESRSAARGQP